MNWMSLTIYVQPLCKQDWVPQFIEKKVFQTFAIKLNISSTSKQEQNDNISKNVNKDTNILIKTVTYQSI